jgi:hypothetical protein
MMAVDPTVQLARVNAGLGTSLKCAGATVNKPGATIDLE